MVIDDDDDDDNNDDCDDDFEYQTNNLYISYIMNYRFHSLQNLEFSINNKNKYDKQIVKNILQISKNIFEYQNRQLVINIDYRE